MNQPRPSQHYKITCCRIARSKPASKPKYCRPAPPPTKRQGDLGEITFLCDASHHGFDLSKPYGDNQRYDFLLDNGKNIYRIQVKTTSKQTSPGRYQVNCGRRLTLRAVPYTKSEIDFLAVYIRPEKLWFILPQRAIAGKVTLILYSPTHPTKNGNSKYLEAWHLLRPQTRKRRKA